MLLKKGSEVMQYKNAIALGTFDGVHVGHRAVLSLPECECKTAVTFAVPPKSVISGGGELITSIKDKCKILQDLGFDSIELLEFEKVRDMSSTDFLEFLKTKYNPDFISCGYNYKFGKNGEGNTEILKEFCLKNGIELRVVECVKANSTAVSSTVIRKLLANGEIDEANKLLSAPFSFENEVIQGDKRGREIGFPTINQKYPEELVKIKFGVYKVYVEFEGERFEGITNIGIRPTYESKFIISETYIKDFSGDVYGKNVRIIPVKFLREEIKFSSVEELKNQINTDLNNIKEI